jgi:hypothetical protein
MAQSGRQRNDVVKRRTAHQPDSEDRKFLLGHMSRYLEFDVQHLAHAGHGMPMYDFACGAEPLRGADAERVVFFQRT